MRHLFFAGLIAISALLSANAQAQVGVLALPDPQAGKEYAVLSTPVPTNEPDKIEVTEVFWYGCPHCYHLEPIINAWAEKLPDDVHFMRMPALFSKLWNIHGQLFITLDTLGAEQKLHSAIFESIQSRKNLLLTPEDMANFVEQHGVNRDKFLETYNSFGVQTKMEKDKKVLAKYGINGVPVVIVNGKYRVELNEHLETPNDMIRVVDFLINKERNTLKKQTATPKTQAAH